MIPSFIKSGRSNLKLEVITNPRNGDGCMVLIVAEMVGHPDTFLVDIGKGQFAIAYPVPGYVNDGYAFSHTIAPWLNA